MKPLHALAAALALAATPTYGQTTACYPSLLGGYSCTTPTTTYQVQPTALPGQWAISGQDSNGKLYGCVAQETLTGDVVSSCQ
jgi:hypothetical protein